VYLLRLSLIQRDYDVMWLSCVGGQQAKARGRVTAFFVPANKNEFNINAGHTHKAYWSDDVKIL
jgi:hypothetical protein